MESFYRTHKYLVEHVESPVKRDLMYQIDKNSRLVGIKGSRGVGKTTFLLQFIFYRAYSERFCRTFLWTRGTGITDRSGI